MFSRGSVNAPVVNDLVLNGGNFVQEMDKSTSIALTDTAALTARRSFGATRAITFPTASTVLLRRRLAAVSNIALTKASTLVRRPTLTAVSFIGLASSMAFVRRVTLGATAALAFKSEAFLSWKFMRRNARERTIVVTELRTLRVMPERRRIVINADRRDAPIPRDRETI